MSCISCAHVFFDFCILNLSLAKLVKSLMLCCRFSASLGEEAFQAFISSINSESSYTILFPTIMGNFNPTIPLCCPIMLGNIWTIYYIEIVAILIFFMTLVRMPLVFLYRCEAGM